MVTLQTLFTGFGQTSWHTHRIITSHVLTEWMKATNEYPNNRPLPLAYLASKGKKDAATAFLLYKTVIESINLFAARHSISNPFQKLNDLPLVIHSRPWQINPIIEFHNKAMYLQGKDIIESHAQHLESIYSLLVNKIPFDQSYNFNYLPEQYYLPYIWFLHEVGSDRIMEFPIICDLALQAAPNMKVETEAEWQKSCPSWRFVKLTTALKDLKKLNIGKDPKDVIHNYPDYCSYLLDYCGFESFEQVFQKRQDALRVSSEQLITERIMDQALDYRRKYLWCGANPFLDISVWIEIKKLFPALMIQTKDALRVTLLQSEKGFSLVNEFIIELQIQALATQIMGELKVRNRMKPTMQCGFSYYNIPNGCHCQKKGCKGEICPTEGEPFQFIINGDQFEGCFFEAALRMLGTTSRNIDLQYGYKMPSLEELSSKYKT